MKKLSLKKVSLTQLDANQQKNVKGGFNFTNDPYFECIPPSDTTQEMCSHIACATQNSGCFTDTTPRTYEDCTRGCNWG